MDKRSQMRELTAFDQTRKPALVLVSWIFLFTMFFLVEYEWLSPVAVFFIGTVVNLPSFYKSIQRESIQKKYLTSREAKHLVHFNSMIGLLTYPLILVWVYAALTSLISLQTFFLIGAGSFLVSIPAGTWYERHMVQLDDNYVTEAELREEQKWGSA